MSGLRFSDKARLNATGEYVRGTQRQLQLPPAVLHWKHRGDARFEVRHPVFGLDEQVSNGSQTGIIPDILHVFVVSGGFELRILLR